MLNLDWSEAYEIGINFIDLEHKQLLTIMRDIRDSILAGDLAECSALSSTLINEAVKHFRHEETYLEKVNYPGLEEHKKYHLGLLVQARQVKEICDGTDKAHDLHECFDAMEQFLIDDVVNGDLQFLSFLEYEGHIKRRYFR